MSGEDDEVSLTRCGIADMPAPTPALRRAKRIACRAFCAFPKTGVMPWNCCFDDEDNPLSSFAAD